MFTINRRPLPCCTFALDSALYRRAGYVSRVESLNNANPAVLEKRSEALNKKLIELNSSSSGIPGRAYRIAEMKILEGRGEVLLNLGNFEQ